MDFVEDDEPILGDVEEVVWFGQASPVSRVFKVEVDGIALLPNDLNERRLADLARSNQDNRCLKVEGVFKLVANDALEHH